jgi:hypothetical protein
MASRVRPRPASCSEARHYIIRLSNRVRSVCSRHGFTSFRGSHRERGRPRCRNMTARRSDRTPSGEVKPRECGALASDDRTRWFGDNSSWRRSCLRLDVTRILREDRRRPESLEGEPESESQLPEELRMVAMPCPVPPWSKTPNMTATPEAHDDEQQLQQRSEEDAVVGAGTGDVADGVVQNRLEEGKRWDAGDECDEEKHARNTGPWFERASGSFLLGPPEEAPTSHREAAFPRRAPLTTHALRRTPSEASRDDSSQPFGAV